MDFANLFTWTPVRCEHGWTRLQGCRECVPYDRNDVRDRSEGAWRASDREPVRDLSNPSPDPDAELRRIENL